MYETINFDSIKFCSLNYALQLIMNTPTRTTNHRSRNTLKLFVNIKC